MAEDITLTTLALAVLSAVVDYYAAETVDLPSRRYVSDGLPAWDCDQVTVQVRRVFPHSGDLANEVLTSLPFEVGRGVEVAVQVVRCAPTSTESAYGSPIPPTVTEIEASALDVLSDAEMVTEGVRVAYRAGDLPGCRGVVFVQWTGIGPSGGYVGGETVLRLAV